VVEGGGGGGAAEEEEEEKARKSRKMRRRRIHGTSSSSCGNEGSREEVAEIVRVTDKERDKVLCIVDGCLYMYIFTSYYRGLVLLIPT
jgi:hypothetical protein